MASDKEQAAIQIQKTLRGTSARKSTKSLLEAAGGGGGFIKVFVRVRPLGEGRGERGDRVHVDSLNNAISIKPSAKDGVRGTAKDGQPHSFNFERVCDEREDNAALLESVGKPLVESVCEGYNGTLFAYGQTGSGKTYTIGEMAKLGGPHEGVAHRMVRQLFATARAGNPRHFTVSVQFVQIYVEQVHDLLVEAGPNNGPSAAKGLHLREDKTHGVYVEGATSVGAATAEECLDVLRKASSNLRFAATRMNRQSSRSHAVCRLAVEIAHGKPDGDALGKAAPQLLERVNSLAKMVSSAQRRSVDGAPEDLKQWRRRSVHAIAAEMDHKMAVAKTTNATLTLCDLAGSEDVGRSGATGAALAEAKKINTSLLALGNVIDALTQKRPGKRSAPAHVPFRDSVLTRLLQQSLGGNCKTALVVCASPPPEKEGVPTTSDGVAAVPVVSVEGAAGAGRGGE